MRGGGRDQRSAFLRQWAWGDGRDWVGENGDNRKSGEDAVEGA